MKNLGLILAMFLYIQSVYCQNAPKERVRALKVAFITERLDLSSKEAQKFWPIYNTYEEATDKLKRKERESMRMVREADGPDGLQEKQAEKLIDDFLTWEQQKITARKKLLVELKQVISNKKILKLIKAEIDFNRRLLKQLRDRRKN